MKQIDAFRKLGCTDTGYGYTDTDTAIWWYDIFQK
jgi:hypothetical protein